MRETSIKPEFQLLILLCVGSVDTVIPSIVLAVDQFGLREWCIVWAPGMACNPNAGYNCPMTVVIFGHMGWHFHPNTLSIVASNFQARVHRMSPYCKSRTTLDALKNCQERSGKASSLSSCLHVLYEDGREEFPCGQVLCISVQDSCASFRPSSEGRGSRSVCCFFFPFRKADTLVSFYWFKIYFSATPDAGH